MRWNSLVFLVQRSLAGNRRAAAAVALALGGIAVAAPFDPLLPGPKQPIEHIAVSGGLFKAASGNPGCFTGSGTLMSAFPVPRGALLLGATLYVIDSIDPGSIRGQLNRHDVVTGGTFQDAAAGTEGAPGSAVVELTPAQPALLSTPQAINVTVNIASGTCLKGAELHFIRNGAAALGGSTADLAAPVHPQQDKAPDGGPTD